MWFAQNHLAKCSSALCKTKDQLASQLGQKIKLNLDPCFCYASSPIS